MFSRPSVVLLADPCRPWINENYNCDYRRQPDICFLFQVKTPIVNAKSRVLVPGLPGHQAPVKAASQEKRKKDTDTKEVGSVLMMVHQAWLAAAFGSSF